MEETDKITQFIAHYENHFNILVCENFDNNKKRNQKLTVIFFSTPFLSLHLPSPNQKNKQKLFHITGPLRRVPAGLPQLGVRAVAGPPEKRGLAGDRRQGAPARDAGHARPPQQGRQRRGVLPALPPAGPGALRRRRRRDRRRDERASPTAQGRGHDVCVGSDLLQLRSVRALRVVHGRERRGDRAQHCAGVAAGEEGWGEGEARETRERGKKELKN